MPESNAALYPTRYPDINAVLRAFLADIRAILAESLVGMYVYGSLAQGDFDRGSSDIDFIVLTAHEVTDAQFAALGALHERFQAGDSPWAGKIEAAYIRQDALNRPASPDVSYPQLEKGRAFAREALEIGWPFQRAILREQGITLAGPDPRTLMAPVPAQELTDAALAIVRIWQEAARTDPSWLDWPRRRDNQRFVLVTLCRSLYTLERGTLASKSAAARWAREQLEPRWGALVAHALAMSGSTVEDDELAETLAFIDYTADRLASPRIS